MARLVTSARYRSPKKGYIHLSRAYRRVSIVVCSSGLRLRLERDCSQISPCSLKVMLEVLSRNVCVGAGTRRELRNSLARLFSRLFCALCRLWMRTERGHRVFSSYYRIQIPAKSPLSSLWTPPFERACFRHGLLV